MWRRRHSVEPLWQLDARGDPAGDRAVHAVAAPAAAEVRMVALDRPDRGGTDDRARHLLHVRPAG